MLTRGPHADGTTGALHAARDGYARLYGELLWPTWQALRRRPTTDHLAELERTQWFEPEALERLQLDRLRLLLAHAGAHVPYYRELFARLRFDPREVRGACDLSELPVLTRELVRERRADLCDPAFAGRTIRKGTSGSTGTPLRFEYSADSEWWRQAGRLRAYRWAGFELGQPTFYYWAMVHGLGSAKERADRLLKREIWFDSMRQDEPSLRAAARLLRRSHPRAMVCFTQCAAQLARFVLGEGLRDWDDLPVICGAEAVLPADRAVLERAFGRVFETYGSRETMLIAGECEAHRGLHLSEENLVVEIARDGALLPAGRSGDVLVTDLHNYAMPFIRYQIGDLATLSTDGACPCGRGLRRLHGIDGRRADTLHGPDGAPIPGIVFYTLFIDPLVETVKQFQAVQRAGGEVIFRAVRGRDFRAETFEAAMRKLAGHLHGLPLSVEFVDHIELTPAGKHRMVMVEGPGIRAPDAGLS